MSQTSELWGRGLGEGDAADEEASAPQDPQRSHNLRRDLLPSRLSPERAIRVLVRKAVV